jgi:hypothetical protein
MPGSFDLDYATAALVNPALPVAVYAYDPSSGYTILPNVLCLRIEQRAGGEPPVARFEYRMSQAMESAFGWPSQFEEIWPIDAQGPYVVQSDQRIVVGATLPDGSLEVLFDGLAQVPQVEAWGDGQRATFAAMSVAGAASFDVIHTRVQRDADTPDDTSGNSDWEIEAPCRFNPQGTRSNGTTGFLGNATPNALYTITQSEPTGYPVFTDPLLVEREMAEGNHLVDAWFVADALLYLLVQPNPGDPYITWPSSGTINQLLETLVPPPGQTFDPATATPANCVIRDYDASNKPLPRVLADLLGYAGFYYSWETSSDASGNPQTTMNIFRIDAAGRTPKYIYLAPYAGTSSGLDPSLNNAARLSLGRDSNGIVNAFRVETAPKEVELTVWLAPAFVPSAGDATPSPTPTSGWNQFKKANLSAPGVTSATRRKYRWFIADECGDGHQNMETGQWSVQPIDLSPVFPPDGLNRTYAIRYRPGRQTLISLDDAGVPRKATLEVYVGAPMADPYVASAAGGVGNLLAITSGWRLLPDRLGIEVTCEDPEQWHTGNPDPRAPALRLITWLAKPNDPASKKIAFRLTTVIDADRRIKAEVDKRPASPTQFARWRSADAQEHFQHREVAPGALYYAGNGTDPTVVRDDTQNATDHGRQLQSAHEMATLAGSVTIPFITTYYRIGDRIAGIAGRDASLQTNVGASAGEAPTYPWVVGIAWSFDGDRQSTTLQLSDRRSELNNSW